LNHEEIRIGILGILYEKFYEYGEGLLLTDTVIIELNAGMDSIWVNKDITYLCYKNLILGCEILGNEQQPSHIRISEIGIDFVERVMSNTLDKTQDEALKQKLKLILNDPNPSSRIRRFLDLTNSYSSHAGLIMNVVKKLLKQSNSKSIYLSSVFGFLISVATC
jgi:hypothetical protein